MFDSVGWGEILVLIVAGLFILGPERLPSAAAWLGKSIRQVKEYASGARDQLRGELGPEFDELRKPLDELRSLRNFNPRTMVHRTLFDDEYPAKPNGFAPGPDGATNGAGPYGAAAPTAGPNLTKAGGTPQPHPAAPPVPETLARNERPPIDDDAT